MRMDISNDEFDNSGPRSGSSVTSIKHVLMEDLDEDITSNASDNNNKIINMVIIDS